ncbi:MAG: porin [Alphaproteobacteria bacterium]
MKLSTLFLSSAALVVAGSAYAADLPAKKGAPAAKPAATGCPAFGAGFFQIPGGDNCIQFSGYMRNTTTNTSGSTTNSAGARVAFDVRSNSDMGVVRGYLRTNTTAGGNVTSDRAYAQIAGLTAGAYGAFFDIAGSNGIGFGSGLGGDTGRGIKYSMALGSASVTAALQDQATGDTTKGNQDILGSVALPVGPGTIQVNAASHSNAVSTGYAVAAVAKLPAGPVNVNVYGGISSGAIAYTGVAGTASTADSASGSVNDGTAVGTSVSMTAGQGTFYVDIGRVTEKLNSTGVTGTATSYSVGYDYTGVKGIQIIPEYYHTDDNTLNTSTNTIYLRIQRDF